MAKDKVDMRCTYTPFSIGHLYATKNTIEENPVYQRESAVWSEQKQSLFIDSLINGFDIPKIYFHDMRDNKGLKKYAVVDGKQRLYSIDAFLNDKFPLAEGFELSNESDYQDLKPGMYFKDFSPEDRTLFQQISLPVVLINSSSEDDIEDLFFRLNNGEPLKAAESRNAFGGVMATLVRETITHQFFTKKLKFKNKRGSHLEISAKFILLEMVDMNNKELFSDLKKKYLDEMVKSNKNLTAAQKEGLQSRVRKNLSNMSRVFNDSDPLLSKQATPPLYYLFVKIMEREYGHKHLFTFIRDFLEQFEVKRLQNLQLIEEERDPALTEFSRLMQQGTNDIVSLKTRISILTRYFLLDYPEIRILDKKRHFTPEERFVIHVLGGKQCASCHKILDIKEMEADHIDQHKFGGETVLKNARALCGECNLKEKKNVQ